MEMGLDIMEVLVGGTKEAQGLICYHLSPEKSAEQCAHSVHRGSGTAESQPAASSL